MNSAGPYYPPRARWNSPVKTLCFKLGRGLSTFGILTSESGIKSISRDTFLSLLIPGYVFPSFGYPLVGKIAMSWLVIAWLIFFAWLGYPVATVAYASILSLHVTSIAFLMKRFAPNLTLVFRILSTFLILFVLDVYVYGFLQRHVEQSFMPLRIGKNVVIVHAQNVKNLKRGDWIAYRIDPHSIHITGGNYHGSIVAEQGFGLERVMAGPRDAVRFDKNTYRVNEQTFAGKPFMPSSGEFTLASNLWLVWPKFSVHGGGIPETRIANFLQGYAVISDKQMIGKPFVRWFGRKQILP